MVSSLSGCIFCHQEGKDKQFLLNLLNQVKLSGGMAYAKAGPSIPRAVQQQISQERPGILLTILMNVFFFFV